VLPRRGELSSVTKTWSPGGRGSLDSRSPTVASLSIAPGRRHGAAFADDLCGDCDPLQCADDPVGRSTSDVAHLGARRRSQHGARQDSHLHPGIDEAAAPAGQDRPTLLPPSPWSGRRTTKWMAGGCHVDDE
jgi:hypothetical protein